MNQPVPAFSIAGGQKSKFDLTGKIAVVTGAGRGIGRAIAIGLAQHGADVVVTSRNPDHVQQTVQAIGQVAKQSLGFVCDVAVPDQINEMVAAVMNDLRESIFL